MRNSSNTCARYGVVGLAILLLLSGFSAAAFAQGGTSTVTGTVMDPKGLSVPQAKIVVLNTETGIERPLSTTDAGVYTATFLQPGHYQDRKSTRLNSSHPSISYAVFCLKKKN